MRVEFHPAARQELAEAIAWYDEQREGLGDEFLLKARQAAERIVQFPNAWSKMGGSARRCRLKRFPYGIVYQVRPELIAIIAVAHLHRAPDYWMDRL